MRLTFFLSFLVISIFVNLAKLDESAELKTGQQNETLKGNFFHILTLQLSTELKLSKFSTEIFMIKLKASRIYMILWTRIVKKTQFIIDANETKKVGIEGVYWWQPTAGCPLRCSRKCPRGGYCEHYRCICINEK